MVDNPCINTGLAAALRHCAALLELAASENQSAAVAHCAEISAYILHLASLGGNDPSRKSKGFFPGKIQGKDESSLQVDQKLPQDKKCPELSQSVPSVTLFDLPAIPEQRLQCNRIYSDGAAAIRKRRQRARQKLSQTVHGGQKVSQSVTKCPKMSQNEDKNGENVPPSYIANTNYLAIKPQALKPSTRILEHLGTLNIESESLYREYTPLPADISSRLDLVGIPHQYFHALANRYFQDGLDDILNDICRKYKDPKTRAKYFSTQNKTTCSFLRWVIAGIKGDKYGRKTINIRLTNKNSHEQLYPAAALAPSETSTPEGLYGTEEEQKRQMEQVLANLPWAREKQQKERAS